VSQVHAEFICEEDDRAASGLDSGSWFDKRDLRERPAHRQRTSPSRGARQDSVADICYELRVRLIEGQRHCMEREEKAAACLSAPG